MLASLVNFSRVGFADTADTSGPANVPFQTFVPASALVSSETDSIGQWQNTAAALKQVSSDNREVEDFSQDNSAYVVLAAGQSPAVSAAPVPAPPVPEDESTATATLPTASTAVGTDTASSSLPVTAQADDLQPAAMTASPTPVSNADVPLPDAAPPAPPTDATASLAAPAPLLQDQPADAPSASASPAAESDSSSTDTAASSSPGARALIASPELEFTNFNIPDGPDVSVASATPLHVQLAISAAGPQNPGAYASVQYAAGSSAWRDAGRIEFDAAQSPAKNGGNFLFALPDTAYGDIAGLRIRLVYYSSQSMADPAMFVGGVWFNTSYTLQDFGDDGSDDLSQAAASSTFEHLDFQNQLLAVSLPSDLANPISVARKGSLPFGIAVKNVSANSAPVRTADTVTYPDAFTGTDLQYRLQERGLKENIILKNKNHPRSFTYAIDTQDYDVNQIAPNAIDFYKKGRLSDPLSKLYSVTAPLMTDAAGHSSPDLKFKLKHGRLVLTPDRDWLAAASYPVTIDPNVDISVLNVSSFPVAGGYWTIDFTTIGSADLSVTPADADTLSDMQFSSLTCDGSDVSTSVDGTTGAVHSPGWSCGGVGEIKFLDLKTGHHHMIFDFGGTFQDAYNGANVWNGNAADGKWETNGNWSTNAAPVSSDDVVINTATTVNINAATTIHSLTLGISGGGTASTLNFNYNAIAGSPLTTSGDLTVYGTASVTHTAATSTIAGKIYISVGGNATITGSITANGKGYQGGQGTGAGAAGSGGGGASYGGSGSVGSGGALGGSPYGSLTNPLDLGSGGGIFSGDISDFGGGAIWLTVAGTTTIGGTLSADGIGANFSDGGGSGGSVKLTTGTLSGSGTMSAKGGNGANWTGQGGGGGGGRIAVYYTTDNSSVTYQAYGGSFGSSLIGGAGTIYKKSAAQTGGDVTLNNNSLGSASYFTFGATALASVTLDSLTVTNSASAYLTASSATATTVTLSNSGTYNASAGTILNYTTLNWSGGVVFDSGGGFPLIDQNQDVTVLASSTLVEAAPSSTRTYNNVTINGTLTTPANTSATTGTASLYKINLIANGNFTISSTGSINVDGKGYPGGQGPGAGTNSNGGAGGASYGGVGSASDSGAAGGSSYGSLMAPTDLGSGGGKFQGDTQSYGGGAVLLSVTGTTTISGTISAKGTSLTTGATDGGGSGGTVNITTGALAGSGSINASGGNGINWVGISGGGGGGRVAVHDTTDGSSISYSAAGGYYVSGNSLPGAPGTIFKKSASETNGDLIIDNNNFGGSDPTVFPLTPIGAYTFDSITLQNSGAVFLNASSATATTLTLSNNGYYDARLGTRLNSANLSIVTAGFLSDSGGTTPQIDQNQDITVPTGLTLIMNQAGATRTYRNVTINGTLTHAYNTSATTTTPDSSLYKINWTATGNLTLASGGSVNLDGRGFSGSNGPGAGTASSGAGGSYGGLGGASSYAASSSVASIYGSSTAPTDLGSGGVSGCSSSAGGGAVKFNVQGNVVINGTISANGTNLSGNCSSPPGAGSGGSIYIISSDFAGSGNLSAIGGNSYTSGCCAQTGGGGGGGRIAVYLTTNTNNAVMRTVAAGGSGTGHNGFVGTLYPVGDPTVTTQNPTSIADTSVTGNGTVTAINYFPITQHGQVISASSNPTLATSISTSQLGSAGSTGAYSSPAMAGLTHDTNYHIRSYATTVGGTVYGNDVAFITDAPAILTQADYRFYQNTNTLQPAVSLANQNVSPSIYSTSTPIRLVMNVGASTDFLPAGVGSFKLQVSTATTTGWLDVGQTPGTWWNTSWGYRRKITFNNASSTTDLANFPVLVSLNATTTGNIDYTKTKAGGADIRFLSSDGSTLLPYEIEKWDTSATSTVWVKLPTIHATSTTDYMYLYYGNASASDAQTPSSVWDGNYIAVWHMNNNAATTTVTDSSSNTEIASSFANTNTKTTSTPWTDGALGYNGANDYVLTPNLANKFTTETVTLDVWFKANAAGVIISELGQAVINNSWHDSQLEVESNGNVLARVYNLGTVTLGNVSFGTWHEAVVRYNKSTLTMDGFLDGVVSGSSASGDRAAPWESALGQYYALGATDSSNLGTGAYFNGIIDEFRISSTTRTSDYYLAEYKNGSGQFSSYASEESEAVVTSPAAWSFYNNLAVASGTTVSSLLLSTSNVQETYEENNPTITNPNQISVGQKGEWDFAVLPNYSVVNATYYFRMVKSDGTLLDAYTTYPSVTLLPDNAPDAPATLGPAAMVNASFGSSTRPNFSFSLSDPDATDTVSFDIQISTTSDFSGLVIDYTSALQAQGAASFTVGQAAGSGSYAVGSSATTLADSSSGYYWRVLANDLHGLQSAYSVANGGSAAFKIDATAPSPGTLSFTSVGTDSITLNLSGASDAGSGLAAAPYQYTNVTLSTSTAATSSTVTIFSGLSPNTLYSFYATVFDALRNSTSTVAVATTTLALPTPAPTSTPSTSSTGGGGGSNPVYPVSPTTTPSSLPIGIFAPLNPISGNILPAPTQGQGKGARPAGTPAASAGVGQVPGGPSGSQPIHEARALFASGVPDILGAFIGAVNRISAATVGANPLRGSIEFLAVGFLALASESMLLHQGLLWSLTDAAGIWWAWLRFWYGLLGVLGLRKKRRYWGTVYDSQNKQPLDPVIVELVDAESGNVLEQSITDITGRFGFLDRVGRFTIRADKSHYAFPSKIILGAVDTIYGNLYHGEEFAIGREGDVISPNVPMDPLAFDWNQQDKQRVVKFHPYWETALYYAFNFLFWCGALYNVMAVITNPSPANIAVTSVYALMVAARILLPHPRLWGQVTGGSRSLAGLQIQLSPAAIPQVTLAKADIAPDGRFFLKAPPQQYVLKITDPATRATIYSETVTIGEEGVFNRTVAL